MIGDTITSTLGANAIKVQSLGLFGTTTGALTNASSVKGGLNSLNVKGDVREASFQTGQGIGSIFIGGSLIGVGSSGKIATGSKVNSLTIGGDVVGGSGLESGHIHLGGVGTLTIGGSLIGGSGEDSGFIRVLDGNSTIKIAGDILGGSGQASGFIDANGVLLQSDCPVNHRWNRHCKWNCQLRWKSPLREDISELDGRGRSGFRKICRRRGHRQSDGGGEHNRWYRPLFWWGHDRIPSH